MKHNETIERQRFKIKGYLSQLRKGEKFMLAIDGVSVFTYVDNFQGLHYFLQDQYNSSKHYYTENDLTIYRQTK